MQRWPVEKKAPLTARFDGDLEVGIVEHDQRILAAHLQLELLHRRRTATQACAILRPVATEPVKEIAATSGMLEQRLADHRAAAHHQVEHAGRQAGARDDLGERMRRARHEIGRLEHHACCRSRAPARSSRRGSRSGNSTA